MYTVKVAGEQGNKEWKETAKTLIGAMRKARKEAAIGISYVIYDSNNNPVKHLVAWQQLRSWGHDWKDVE